MQQTEAQHLQRREVGQTCMSADSCWWGAECGGSWGRPWRPGDATGLGG